MEEIKWNSDNDIEISSNLLVNKQDLGIGKEIKLRYPTIQTGELLYPNDGKTHHPASDEVWSFNLTSDELKMEPGKQYFLFISCGITSYPLYPNKGTLYFRVAKTPYQDKGWESRYLVELFGDEPWRSIAEADSYGQKIFWMNKCFPLTDPEYKYLVISGSNLTYRIGISSTSITWSWKYTLIGI